MMVTVEEALQLENACRNEAEEKEFCMLQGIIDSHIYGHFNGGSFAIVSKTSAKIAASIKTIYDKGGWRVFVTVAEGGQFKFVFSPY
jgi:hypothetical protein